ncbi:TonB-dependent receptor [Draconibacterium halophilum]|uniref:TonB-dependent receptor n=1 Tax=Draconibacterium halophilum TaxID=2706887 RepID=A0A6C0RIV3_9BACT|nr:TonB-dependent receptor [Draconibacterium halophilum]QIA09483.1 TonB-dependent receptor [Draconibacterium halophilum]
MKTYLSIILLLIIVSTSFGQTKRRDKVKRKYRNTEAVSRELPTVYVRGSVYDSDYNLLPGAHVSVDGTYKGVNTNEDGEYFITNLVPGRARIRVSFIGFETRTVDIILQEGRNEKNVMLPTDDIHLEPILVSAQKREQQLLDVPTAISSVSDQLMDEANITDLSTLGDFVPGMYVREQGANRPTFSIRGLSSDEVSPSAQPRVSVYFNNVPINRANSASLELYDMDRVEVLKGPQNTLFGRGAQAGAVHYVSKMPDNDFYGSVTAGWGDYGTQEYRGMVNVPLIDNKLMLRAAGIYNKRDGYIENTFDGDLMGKETLAGRFSARFKPAWNHRFDVVLNYQKDDTPGVAFMPDSLPNTNGDIGIFSGVASHEQGENLGTAKEIFDATLNYRLYMTEHTYWTSITSYRTTDASSRWDGDGTASAAIDMAEYAGASQFYQELRGNFSQNSRLNGSLGGSFWMEKADQTYWFSPNEQHLASLMFLPQPTPVMPNGQPMIIPALPPIPEYGMEDPTPLPADHQEENYSEANNMAAEGFIDINYQVSRKIFISAGVRAVYDRYKLKGESSFVSGSSSGLGILTGNYPNVFFLPYDSKEIKKNTLSYTWRGGLKYRFNEYGNVFANYSRGRRPAVLQFTSTGEEEVLEPEILDNYELGFKGAFYDRVFVDVTGFYQLYKDFQTRAWVANNETGEYNLLFKDGGQATAYGAEASLRVAIIEQLDLFANYAWLKTEFDSTDVDGSEQLYAGNVFSLAPEHSFAVGLNARVNITPNIKLFVTPSYSYKSHIYFEDANTPGLEQDGYGLLNINGGLELADPNIRLTIWANNVLDEQFITSAGNTGSLFGVPTFVPGPPRMIGAKLTWYFTKEERRRR